jgi:predicted porin
MKLGNLTKTVALSALLVSVSTTAFNTDFLSVSTEGEVDYGTSVDSDWKDNSGLSLRASMTLEAQLTDSIKAVITAELKEALMASGDWDSIDLTDNKLEEMVREAYIEVKMVKGSPVAFIVGKQEIAFGQNFSGLAMTDRGTNSAMSGISRVDGVVGLTVKLDTNFFGLIDSVEASVFENGSGDFEVGKMNNASIRLGGDLMENLRVSASYMNQEVAGEREQTASVGVIYTNGDWTAHVEAIGMIDNDDISDSTFAINTGLAYDMGHGTVAVEYTWIEDSINQLGLSYETEIANGVKVGPQGTYDVDSGDFGAGVRLSFTKKVTVGKKGSTLLGN